MREAYMNAFSKILIVVLSTGKATATFEEPSPNDVMVNKQDVGEAFARDDVDAEYSNEFGEPQERPWTQ